MFPTLFIVFQNIMEVKHLDLFNFINNWNKKLNNYGINLTIHRKLEYFMHTLLEEHAVMNYTRKLLNLGFHHQFRNFHIRNWRMLAIH
jgi:hypothetical protein